jgi:hypothetical protein
LKRLSETTIRGTSEDYLVKVIPIACKLVKCYIKISLRRGVDEIYRFFLGAGEACGRIRVRSRGHLTLHKPHKVILVIFAWLSDSAHSISPPRSFFPTISHP